MTKRILSDREAILGLIVCLSLMSSAAQAAGPVGYAGAAACRPCHEGIYEDWSTSGHASILRKTADPRAANLPLPAGFTRKDISYIVGGYRWKAIFVDREGFIVTSTRSGRGKNQYNVRSGTWSDYRAGEKAPYDCGRCHATGFVPEGHQAGRRGTVGQWAFDGVQCEACHGPGLLHSRTARKADITADPAVCSRCHETDPPSIIPVTGVFLAPYTEANQLRAGGMGHPDCTLCHDPHKRSAESIRKTCESCHIKAAAVYDKSYLRKAGVTCVDCHMPRAGLVAEGNARTFEGDLRSHLFRIDHSKPLAVAERDGRRINPGYLSIDYACMPCHSVYETRDWAARFGLMAHRIMVSPNLKIMDLQMVLAFIGFLSAGTSLLSGLSLKKWVLPAQNIKRTVSIHRHTAWISFSVFFFVSILCVDFHFPVANPAKALNLGWFLVHPVNGVVGFILYGGKLAAVRWLKRGWAWPGVLWGALLFMVWTFQIITVTLTHFHIVPL